MFCKGGGGVVKRTKRTFFPENLRKSRKNEQNRSASNHVHPFQPACPGQRLHHNYQIYRLSSERPHRRTTASAPAPTMSPNPGTHSPPGCGPDFGNRAWERGCLARNPGGCPEVAENSPPLWAAPCVTPTCPIRSLVLYSSMIGYSAPRPHFAIQRSGALWAREAVAHLTMRAHSTKW